MILEDQEINDAAEAFQNLAGDGDLDQQSGLIEVDRSEPLHPVIRFRLDRSKIRSGRSSGSGSSAYPSVFEIVEDSTDSGGNTVYTFANQYYEVSGVLYDLASQYTFTLQSVADKYLAVVLSSVSTPNAHIVEYQTFDALQAAMATETQSVIPLYKFNENGAIECDLRHIPRADMWTVGTIASI